MRCLPIGIRTPFSHSISCVGVTPSLRAAPYNGKPSLLRYSLRRCTLIFFAAILWKYQVFRFGNRTEKYRYLDITGKRKSHGLWDNNLMYHYCTEKKLKKFKTEKTPIACWLQARQIFYVWKSRYTPTCLMVPSKASSINDAPVLVISVYVVTYESSVPWITAMNFAP